MRPRNIVFAFLIIALLIAGGFVYLGEITPNTTGVAYKSHGAEGNSNANGGGDLLDVTSYVTSWAGGGLSEKIVVQGKFRLYWDIPGSTEVKRIWYKVFIEGSGAGVKINGVETTEYITQKYAAPAQDVYPDKWYPSELVIVQLTNPFQGKVHVEYWADQQWDFGLRSGSNKLSEDEAWLRSGIGKVSVANDVVEEGTNVYMNVQTGYAQSEKPSVAIEGWFLNIYNPAGTSVWQKQLGDNFDGQVSWLVPTGSYKETWSNIFKVVLRNLLLNQDDDYFFAVGPGMLAQIPAKPSFSVLAGTEPFQKGDQITVQLNAVKTFNEVTGFWVWVSYETTAGGTTEYIIQNAWFPAKLSRDGLTYTAQVTFTFPDAGFVRMEASTVDTKNLNSGIAEMKWTVSYTGPDVDRDLTFLILIALAMLALIVVAVVLAWKVPPPLGYYLAALLIVVAIAVMAFVVWGSSLL